ncbi:MAG: transglutaminase-like cysteine peptidase [Alphaproteobacteria bacterium]|nr:transglutaminase-like cysteine peptidase [Alphaproteobacteria bacterium]
MRDGRVRSRFGIAIALAAFVASAPAWPQAQSAAPVPDVQAGQSPEAKQCSSPSPEVSALPGEGVVFSGTGQVFTLPPEPADPQQAAAACEPPGPPPPVRPPAPDVFGASALAVGSRMVNAQWTAVRGASLAGVSGTWTELLDQANTITHGEPLEMVNRWVNWHVRYVDDQGGDRWAPAAETLGSRQGDCEDFAIAKMALLAELGIPADDMFLVLVRERRRPLDHAVLIVRRAGRTWVLDNRTDALLAAGAVTDYTPRMSFSGIFAWTYGYRDAGRVPAARNPAPASP